MNLRSLFDWLYEYLLNYNLFPTEIGTNDNDANESQESAIVLKRQRYATWLYVVLLIGEYYIRVLEIL